MVMHKDIIRLMKGKIKPFARMFWYNHNINRTCYDYIKSGTIPVFTSKSFILSHHIVRSIKALVSMYGEVLVYDLKTYKLAIVKLN